MLTNLLVYVICRYNVILNTVSEAGSWGSYWVYTGIRGAASAGELPAYGTELGIILYIYVSENYIFLKVLAGSLKIKELVK